MTKYILPLLIAVLLFTFAQNSQAALSPVSVSIVPPAQFPPNDFAITGARVSALWGKHRNVYGIDVGLLGNITEQTFTGLAVAGIFNNTRGTTTITGLQLAGITNINTSKTRIFGLQAALAANINSAETSITGLQFALANISGFTTIYGVQAGLYNRAKTVYGFQIGLINSTDDLHGIQIGLVNFNKSGPFAISPILNVGF